MFRGSFKEYIDKVSAVRVIKCFFPAYSNPGPIDYTQPDQLPPDLINQITADAPRYLEEYLAPMRDTIPLFIVVSMVFIFKKVGNLYVKEVGVRIDKVDNHGVEVGTVIDAHPEVMFHEILDQNTLNHDFFLP